MTLKGHNRRNRKLKYMGITFSEAPRLILRSTQTPIRCVPGVLSGDKRIRRELDHSLPYNAEVNNVWSYTPTNLIHLQCMERDYIYIHIYIYVYIYVYIYIYIYTHRRQNNVVDIVIKLWDRQNKKRGLIVGKGPNRFGSQFSLLFNP